jgi:hypothetical protein
MNALAPFLPQLVIAAVAAVAVLLALRGWFLGYGTPRHAPSMLNAKEQAVVSACADAFFPTGGAIPLSGTDAGVIAYFDQMVGDTPPKTRFLIRLLLRFIEHGPWVFGLRGRFTRQSPEDRVRTLRSWETSSIYFLRISFQSIRTLLAMAYMANDDVTDRIGAAPNLSPFAREVAA